MGNIYILREQHLSSDKAIKNTNIKIVSIITNTIGNIPRKTSSTNKYDHTSIYKLTCLGCQKSYVHRSDRIFKNRIQRTHTKHKIK
jgi:hypothetical protein